ncbi:bacteriophage spanin2 family protein [Falsihalocynthiibacter arcticus]|uniref:bacteriophage spanin2 family protein n=1 Tax=Falsihalocynthiibacter arcticus TaxID=1579316 RepID=UPI00300395E4
MVALAGCGPLKFLAGAAGPNVAANVQAGQSNAQTLGTSQAREQTIEHVQAARINQSSDVNRVRAETVKTVVVNEVPPWVILLALVGWILPSPGEISRAVARWIARRRA